MPPQGRNWKGSVVAPFAGNNMLVLYQCPGKTSDASTSGGQNNSVLRPSSTQRSPSFNASKTC